MLKALKKLCCHPFSNIDYHSFHIALEEVNIPLVEYFIGIGADIEVRTNDADGLTALGLALYKDESLFDFLLTKNANIHAKDKRGNTLLAIAAFLNNIGRVEFFLDQGIDINSKGHLDSTPLMVASMKGHLEVVRLLVSRGADVNARNKFGNTALFTAAKLNRLDVIKYLWENGANLDIKGKNGNTALMIASKNGYTDVVEFLVEKGALQEITNDKGDTALSLAQKYLHGKSCGVLGAPETITLQERLDNIGCGDIVPEKYLCPISYVIMDDPVTISSGHTFDRKSLIQNYLTHKEFPCPMTRKPIKKEELKYGTSIIIKSMLEDFVTSQEEAIKHKELSEADELQLAPVIIKKQSSENVYRLFSNAKRKERDPEGAENDDEDENITDRTPLLGSSSSSGVK